MPYHLKSSVYLSQFGPDCPNKEEIKSIKYYFSGKFIEAEKAARKSVQTSPNCASGYDVFGNTLLRLGKLEEAIQAYEKSVEIYSNSPSPRLAANPLINLGITYISLDNEEKSSQSFCQALQLEPFNISTLEKIASIASNQENKVSKQSDIFAYCEKKHDIDFSPDR